MYKNLITVWSNRKKTLLLETLTVYGKVMKDSDVLEFLGLEGYDPISVSYDHVVTSNSPATTMIDAYLSIKRWQCGGQLPNGEKVWESRWYWSAAWLVDGVVTESQAYDMAVAKAKAAGFNLIKIGQHLTVNVTVKQQTSAI
jgi:hypothetical protein